MENWKIHLANFNSIGTVFLLCMTMIKNWGNISLLLEIMFAIGIILYVRRGVILQLSIGEKMNAALIFIGAEFLMAVFVSVNTFFSLSDKLNWMFFIPLLLLLVSSLIFMGINYSKSKGKV
jgi:hypothetical protein